MDYKTFRRQLAEKLGRKTTDIDALVEGLSMVLRHSCGELDSVAIQTFGTFAPKKHPETIVNDLTTGKRMLIPPEITVEFRPGAMLTKRMR